MVAGPYHRLHRPHRSHWSGRTSGPRLAARDLLWLLLPTVFAWATGAQAQDISARSYVSSNPAPLNRPFDLNVEVTGAQTADGEPVLPDDIGEFADLMSTGRTSTVRMVNGETRVSVIWVYRFQPNREGSFLVGPIEVQVGGQTLYTDPLALIIGNAPPQGSAPPPSQTRPQPRPQQPQEPAVTGDDIFITAEVSDRRVFVGEPVIVEYRIWTRVNVSQYSATELPANTGFWVEEFPIATPEVEQIERDGVPFATAVIRKVALFPTGPGTRTVEPLGIEAQIRVRRRSNDVLDDFFNRSLLGRLEPVLVSSDPVEIQVDPLPDGQPRGFSGFVGNVDMSLVLDRGRVETNDAVSLTLRLQAEGNIQTLPEPDISFPSDFEVYPPEVSERIDRTGSRIRGTKTYQYVLIPRSPGTQSIPAVTLDYFDPRRAAFATAATDPIDIDVTGDPVDGSLIVRPGRGSIEPLREDIRFISIEIPRFTRSSGSLVGNAGFWLLLLVPAAAVGGALGVRRHLDRLSGDVAWARSRRATRTARKRLAGARNLLHGDGRAFYAEVDRALQGFLGDKLNLPEAGLMKEVVRERLSARGVSSETLDAYLACLDECERQRFAPVEGTTGEREAFLARAGDAMGRLDKEAGR